MGERADRPAQNRNELAPRLKLYERSSGLPVQVKDQDRFNPFISFIMYRFATMQWMECRTVQVVL